MAGDGVGLVGAAAAGHESVAGHEKVCVLPVYAHFCVPSAFKETLLLFGFPATGVGVGAGTGVGAGETLVVVTAGHGRPVGQKIVAGDDPQGFLHWVVRLAGLAFEGLWPPEAATAEEVCADASWSANAFSLAKVSGPTLPTWSSPARAWKRLTARVVSGPKKPVTLASG